MDPYENLKNAGLTLPPPSGDSDTITMAKRFGESLLYVSGMGPVRNGRQLFAGTVPGTVSMSDAAAAAEQCALNILSSVEKTAGSLERVKGVVKLLVYVASDQGFTQQHIVANGASKVFLAAFGEEIGKAARSAIGVARLPLDFPVEVEALIELTEDPAKN